MSSVLLRLLLGGETFTLTQWRWTSRDAVLLESKSALL